MSGRLFIISAPSGTGKTSLLKIVMAQIQQLVFSVSHTTRQPRESERDGSDYYFVPREKFQEMIGTGAFLEWATVHDNYYGTALSPLVSELELNRDVILDVDVQGAEIVRRNSHLPASFIFVAPPDMKELEHRLRGRGTENEATIRTRLQNAHEEMASAEKYDYLVINDNLQRASEMVSSIIYAERARGHRTLEGTPIDMELLR
jgi:guanylate kinase